MSWITDELLFYGGMVATGGILVVSILCFSVLQIRMIRLKAQLETEYGRNPKEKKQ